MRIERALVSVSDKSGLDTFARGLHELGVELVSTSGTAAALAEAGIPYTSVEELTGAAEILGGRVKTLHPSIHAGILARRDRAEDMRTLEEQGIKPIDMVVCNLYPFRAVANRREVSELEVIENIDVGGPTMVRAAAKNHQAVAVVTEPDRYGFLLDELRAGTGSLSDETRRDLAGEAFAHTAGYDAAISAWFTDTDPFPEHVVLDLVKAGDLTYGENPHQRAALYRDRASAADELVGFRQLQGKELSFNNLLDVDSAVRLARDLRGSAAVIVKHNNPCGAAVGDNPLEAFGRAFACDPLAAFGGIIAIRGTVDGAVAALVLQHFVEAVAADDFTDEAKTAFGKKPNIRLLQLPVTHAPDGGVDWKRIGGGLLLQEQDNEPDDPSAWRVVSERRPLAIERAACELAWIVARRVKSNAIVIANARQTVGIGAGQMSRVDSCRLAVMKANLPLNGTSAASDAFFPFRDGLDLLADAGVTAVVAPGGSIRDADIFAAADDRKLAFLLAPRRHFRH